MYEQVAQAYGMRVEEVAVLVDLVQTPVWKVLREAVYRPEEEASFKLLRAASGIQEVGFEQGRLYEIEQFWHRIEAVVAEAVEEERLRYEKE